MPKLDVPVPLRFAVLLTAVFTVATTGCSSTGDEPAEPEDEQLETPTETQAQQPSSLQKVEQLREDADEYFRDRADADSALRAAELFDEAADHEGAEDLGDDQLGGLLVDAARAHYFVARYHQIGTPVVDADTELPETVDDGLDAARRALRVAAPDFVAAVDAGAPFEARLPEAPPEATEALLWYGLHLELQARTGDESTTLALRPVVDATMEHVAGHQPELYYGGADRYFGVRAVDRLMARDQETSQQAFERSLEIAPDFLTTDLMKTLHLTVARGDRRTFEQQLEAIVDADAGALPEAEPENEIAQQWAAALLEEADNYFDPPGGDSDPEASR